MEKENEIEIDYCSQLGQDKFIDEYFEKKEKGVFIDIGAHNGKELSNTFFLEKKRNWTGICIEPQPNEYEKLKENRNCITLNCGVYNYSGEIEFTHILGYASMLSGVSDDHNNNHKWRIENDIKNNGGSFNVVNIKVRTLQDILDEYQIYNIDFCSIDTEGSELKILESINFEKTNIKVFIVENNYQEGYVKEFLEKKGYSLHCQLSWDDVFVKK